MKKGRVIADINMKLLGAAGALFAATLLLVMSTLAWFTVANAPMASKIAVGVNGSKNFEIAKANTGDPDEVKEVTADDSSSGEYAWGETVTFDETESAGITVELPITVDDSGAIKTVSFNDTGRTSGLTDAGIDKDDMSNGISYYTYKADNIDKKCAVILGIWLRTNTTGDVYASMEGLTVSGGNSGSGDVTEMVGVGMCINPGGGGQFYKMSNSSEEKVGSLAASDKGTYAEIIVYLDGDKVVAYDVGGETSITVNIESIKFRNSSVEVTAS